MESGSGIISNVAGCAVAFGTTIYTGPGQAIDISNALLEMGFAVFNGVATFLIIHLIKKALAKRK